jgi:hypothetical protein
MKRLSKRMAILLVATSFSTVVGGGLINSNPVSAQELESIQKEAGDAFAEITAKDNPIALIKSTYSVKERTNTAAAVVKSLPVGYQVQIQSVIFMGDEVWYKVIFAVDDVEYTGYIANEDVITSDDEFLNWKNTYSIDTFGNDTSAKQPLPERRSTSTYDENTINNVGTSSQTNVSLFPESYRSLISNLTKAHPNWTFIPFETGLNWDTVIANEMEPTRNLVPINSSDAYKSKDPRFYNAATNTWYPQDSGNWVQSSASAVNYYMDPRNFLNEESIFQYELLTYSTDYTVAGVEAILSGTFMSHKVLEDQSAGSKTYAEVFMELGQKLKVSPYFLASRVRQEQGGDGSPLSSGTYSGYTGYYNYFNIGATGNNLTEVIVSGLIEAKNAGWSTRLLALTGGATKTAEKYIRRGQDTLYLQKFDVDGSYDGRYWHQYMQNLMAADSEGKSVRKAYNALGVLNDSFVFKIPVYNNMPAKTDIGTISNETPVATEPESEPVTVPTITKLGIPTIISGQSLAYVKANIKWENNSGADGTGYQIYRRIGTGKYKLIKTISSAATKTYSDTSVLPNRTYYYKIRTYKKENGTTNYSAFSKVTTISTAIKAPKLSAINKVGKQALALKWSKTSNVNGYVIYRKTSNGSYKKIKTILGAGRLFHTDNLVKTKQTNYYKIRAFKIVKGKYYYSPYSAQKKGKIG